MNEETKSFIIKCQSFTNYMLSSQQWSGISKSDLDLWLSNFDGLRDDELKLIYKLLINIIYFSEKDIIALLSDGVKNKLFEGMLLKKQIKSKFSTHPRALQNTRNDELKKTLFVPLLDSDAPHESANYITRLLVQENIIDSKQSIFSDKIASLIDSKKYNRIVIVDDCVGSGEQITTYWNEKTISIEGGKILLKDYIIENSIEANYLVLFGYNKSVDDLRIQLEPLQIFCIKNLTDSQRVFNNESYIWENEDETTQATDLLKRITMENGIALLGYNNLDFAFIMHKTIPDWSLPLLWKKTSEWHCLLRRKNSDV